ncbi:MAG: nitroreductase [Syntrophales bacterium]|jgi:nitroreductase|nr:nitroreductase [Syntrophales bacterium]MDY0043742.1 nitroreductase [Syntrophales bacterium]
MELKDAIRTRRSIRSFLSGEVKKEIMDAILSDARWSPSWGNTQPWEVLVITGDKLDIFKEKNRNAAFSGKSPNPEIAMPEEWPEINKNRYRDIGKRTLESLSIARADKEARNNFTGEMMKLFNAPVLILIMTDKGVALEYSMLDVGLYVQTLCLLAQERGLGTCIMAAAVQYPDLIRELFEISDSKRIVVGVALGWPDKDNPVNSFDRTRGSMEEFVRYTE